MALRVLLADESTTIKKVMQLALQDFAVEVKAVHAGVDVIEVAKSFHPDIVFADVLLQKKNGYEVCAELKNDPQLNRLPIVLMWSSFLEVDERLASRCGADERLEKPFDVETLRQLILKLVPATRTQRLAHFLDFSQNVTAAMKAENTQNQSAPAAQSQPTQHGQPGPAVRPATTGESPPQLRRESLAVAQAPVPVQMPVQAPVEMPAARQSVPAAPQPPAPIRDASPKSSRREDLQNEHPTDKSNWNMDSFEDISAFSEMDSHAAHPPGDHEPAATNAESHLQLSPFSLEDSNDNSDDHRGEGSGEDSDDNSDGFSEFKLSELSQNGQAGQPFQNARKSHANHHSQSESSTEAWSHQDLSAFKIDLTPVPVEGEGFALTFNVNDSDVEGTGYSSLPDLRTEHAPSRNPDRQAHHVEEDHPGSQSPNELMLELDDQSLEAADSAHLFANSSPESFGDHFEIQPLSDPYQPPRQPMPLEYAPPQSHRRQSSLNSGSNRGPNSVLNSAKSSPNRPDREHHSESPLSEERLEEIIRAQSQAVIEAVVRRLVPDIATQIIQRELARLLDDSPPSE